MTSVKIKYRPSSVIGKQGSIYYQVIHNQVIRQQKTSYLLFQDEWNNNLCEIILTKSNENRKNYLLQIKNRIKNEIRTIKNIILKFNQCGTNFTADDIIEEFIAQSSKNYLFIFMEEVISNMILCGRLRTSETYTSTLSSFKRFRNNIDLALDDVDSNIIASYETYLKANKVCPNTSSFYMRNLRAVYNRAVERNLTIQCFPFKHVYTGIDKTIKRAISLKSMKVIKEMDLSAKPSLDFARDMFLFSFYTRGMSFIDMSYLRKKDLNNGILTYRRRKTRQQLSIRWEKCMQEIVDKYNTSQSIYLLPIIKQDKENDTRKQYICVSHNINRNLKLIGKKVGLSLPLTMYVSRHTWASIAKSKNVPLTVISEGMGHDSEATTRIYLTSLDSTAIDKANNKILNSL